MNCKTYLYLNIKHSNLDFNIITINRYYQKTVAVKKNTQKIRKIG